MATALVLVLIGGPIVILDVTITQGGEMPIDIVNDTIGYGLLLWAVGLLVRQPGPVSYGSRMQSVAVLTAISLGWSLVVQVAPALGASVLGVLSTGVAVLAAALFCVAMRDLSGYHGFLGAEAAWRTAGRVVAIFLGGVWVLSSALLLVQMLDTRSPFVQRISVDMGSGGVLLLFAGLAMLILPLVYVLIAVGTLRRELRAPASPEPAT